MNLFIDLLFNSFYFYYLQTSARLRTDIRDVNCAPSQCIGSYSSYTGKRTTAKVSAGISLESNK